MPDLFTWMNLVKVSVAVTMVVVLTVLAERVSPRFAGIAGGFPLGAALTMFFIAVEVHPQFAANAAIYTIIGMVALQSMLYVYFLTSCRLAHRSDVTAILMSTVGGTVVFMGVAFSLQMVQVSVWTALGLSMASVIFFDRLFRRLENVRIEKRRPTTIGLLLLRALFAAAMVLLITSAARWLGPRRAGLLSSFPMTLLPLMIIIHYTYRAEHVHAIIKNVPRGLVSLVIYCLAVSQTYPTMGIGWGTLVAYALATIYLILVSVNFAPFRLRKPKDAGA